VSTALYRRYRPESFADVIGQDHVTEPLMQALRTGRVSHAYLFSGPRGCGKTTSARILARCLNCEQGPTPVPCGVCDSCVALAREGAGSVDVIEIDAASHGGVDDARDLRERASYGPAISRYKIYIIDEAHMVTPQGFNALLKIVEEPPEHVKFIFATTQPDKVIGTIRSRTHHYPFRLVPPLRLQDYLGELCTAEGVAVAPGVLSFVVRAGAGSVRDSLSVLDQLISGSGDEGLTYQGAAALLGFTEGELLDATIDGLAAGDAGAVFNQIDKVIETGQDPRRFVEDLLERLRDLIVVGAVPDGASSILRGTPQDQLERIRQQSAAFGPGALSRSADIVNAGLTEMTGATSPRLQLELLCARLLLPGASGESGYAARLDRLERRLEMSGPPAPAGPRRHAPASEPVRGPLRPAAAGPPAAETAVEPLLGEPAVHEPPVVEPPADEPPADEPPADEPPADEPPADEPPGVEPAPQATAATRVRPAVDVPPDGLPRIAVLRGGIDTDAIRRSWPDILAKIFTIRRVTWTFLSEHTQVLDYDGKRLLLGIQTEGLTTTFRRGQHAELVRQALSEVLGVEAVVEGIPATQAARSGPPAPAAPSGTAPSGTAQSGTAPSGTAQSGVTPSGATPSGTTPSGTASSGSTPSNVAPSTAGTTAAAAPSAVSPAATGRAASSQAGQAPPDVTHERPITPRQRGRAVVAREVSTRNASPSPSAADDSMVSADDEDIEEALAVGQPVIARVLGGTVIGELDQ